MSEVICVMCPNGCRLTVDENNGYAVTGNACPLGVEYGRAEVTDPRRVLTSTVRVSGGAYTRCPVKTTAGLPKAKVFEAMRLLNGLDLHAPVEQGQVILSNVLDSGADVVATRAIAPQYS